MGIAFIRTKACLRARELEIYGKCCIEKRELSFNHELLKVLILARGSSKEKNVQIEMTILRRKSIEVEEL